MAKHIRYKGEFLSRAGVVWRVELLQEAAVPFASVGDLVFDADEALVIEWADAGKDRTICGSTATIRIESPGDRTYEDLYTIAPGRIRMDVYRRNSPYWSGTLDPEFYEEPYERLDHYDVTLMFSDFGILDRHKYGLSGMRTLREIVELCISKAGIESELDESMISTALSPSGRAMTLADLKVRSDNLYDEDGEASTLEDVLEGVLRPLALRIIQRAGRVYIHDLNALYGTAQTEEVEWNGATQTMGTDKVYNNVKITWSTYAQSGNLTDQDCWEIDTDPDFTNLNDAYGRGGVFSYPFNLDPENRQDLDNVGFTLYVSEQGRNAVLANPDARFFKTVPQYDGQECEGVAVHWPGVRMYEEIKDETLGGFHYTKVLENVEWLKHGLAPDSLKGTLSTLGDAIFKTQALWVPPVDSGDGMGIRIAMDMLMDYRFNPFEEAYNYSNAKQKDWEENWNRRGNFVYVPVCVRFRPEGSSDTYCWDNRDVVASDVAGSKISLLAWSSGRWVKVSPGTEQSVWGYLAYYNTDDRAEKAAIGGWKKNRQAINPHTGRLSVGMSEVKDGQYIPYPEIGSGGGEIWVEVRAGGWIISDGNTNLSSTHVIDPRGLWGKFCWILCRIPEIEIVNGNRFDKTINTDDVEYMAEINADAKEDIEIDTICGSAVGGVPTARGAYFDTSSGKQITELTRAGRTTQVEDLLIGTIFSQFGARRTKLSGEMDIASGPLSVFTEANQKGRRFIITADVQNVITDTSDAVITELRPDEYDKHD